MAHSVGDYLLLRVVCESTNEVSVNNMHYRVDSKTGNGATNSEIAEVMFNRWKNLYAAFMTPQASVMRCSCSRIWPIPPDPEEWSTSASVPGALAPTDQPLPRMVAGILTKLTASAGVRYRGRVYLGYLTETANDTDATPTAAGRALMQALATDMAIGDTIVGVGGSTGINPVIFHKDTKTSTYITGMNARDYWGTQRRRNNDRK